MRSLNGNLGDTMIGIQATGYVYGDHCGIRIVHKLHYLGVQLVQLSPETCSKDGVHAECCAGNMIPDILKILRSLQS